MNVKAYILDTDTLIHAFRYDFPPKDNHSGFWEWLNELSSTIDIIVPEKVRDEIKRGNDELPKLITSLTNIKNEPTSNCTIKLPNVMDAYGVKTEIDLEIIGNKADPYVIAHALCLSATVVTNEISEPAKTEPRNKKIPDICSILDVDCLRYPRFIWEMRA